MLKTKGESKLVIQKFPIFLAQFSNCDSIFKPLNFPFRSVKGFLDKLNLLLAIFMTVLNKKLYIFFCLIIEDVDLIGPFIFFNF